MVVFDRPCGGGEHDRSFFSFSLAACLSGEDSFNPFSLGLYRTNEIRTAPILTRIGARPRYEERPRGPQGGGKEGAVVFSSPHGLPEAIMFVGGCQAKSVLDTPRRT